MNGSFICKFVQNNKLISTCTATNTP